MTVIQISQTRASAMRIAGRAAPLRMSDTASAEFDRMRRSQVLRQVAIALVLAVIAADVAIALDSLARL